MWLLVNIIISHGDPVICHGDPGVLILPKII